MEPFKFGPIPYSSYTLNYNKKISERVIFKILKTAEVIRRRGQQQIGAQGLITFFGSD
jgi:hypothetical protein